ncbi:MAG: glycosyltransferase family 2 protein [Thaumarchaeota archaeon]|nr:glycosyltransferase family 2 protein [Nitrososphaerota archaeon]
MVILFASLLVVALVRISSLWVLSIAYSFRKASAKPPSGKFSVIIPAFNEEKTIRGCVESLASQDYQDYEVIIVDDGSTDRTPGIADSLGGNRVRVVHQQNRGKAEALNAGIASSTGEFIVTVDADTRLSTHALKELSARFASSPRLGALAGNVKVENPRGLIKRLQSVEYAAGLGLARKGQSMLSTVMIVPGPVAAFRRDVLQGAKGFSSETFAEDFDMTLAILEAGHDVEYEDRAVAYTAAPASLEDLMKQRRRWYRGMMQVLSKHENMLLRKRYGVAGMYGLPYVWFDTFSPVINMFLAIFAVVAGSISGDWATILLGLSAYWVIQVLLVVTAVGLDRERKLWQVALSPLMLFYNSFLDGLRTAAFVEEALDIRMRWEKPKR